VVILGFCCAWDSEKVRKTALTSSTDILRFFSVWVGAMWKNVERVAKKQVFGSVMEY
jgi:hypothetical protein